MPYFSATETDFDAPMESDFDPDQAPRAVVAFGADVSTRRIELGAHRHRKAQLLLTLRGVVTVEANQGVWIVPPQCAVWIPGDLPHSITASGTLEIYCAFVAPEAAPSLPDHCCTLTVSPLLRHLLLEISKLPLLYDEGGADGRLARVLLDQLAMAPVEGLNFPMPADPRLRRIAAAMLADPADRATIAEWGKRAGIAPRTLTRTLLAETGMSFGRWRQQFDILIALRRLAEGATVQAVALELGYEGASAFVTMFRKALGKPPARYLAEREAAR